MAASGRSTNVYIASYFSWCCTELLNPIGVIFYKMCFKLLKTFKELHKTVDSRDCGASEQKEG